MSYVDVKDKSAADLHKQLSILGDEFVQHTGSLATADVFTLGLVSRESEKDEIAGWFCSVLGLLEAETNQILTMNIDTLKGFLSKEFPNISIAEIVKFVKTLPGDIHFPWCAFGQLKIPIVKYLKYTNFATNWRDIRSTTLVNIIISKFGPAVQPVIESELFKSELRRSDKDRDRLGTLFDVIDKVSVQKDLLARIFNNMNGLNMFVANVVTPSPSGTSGSSGNSNSGKKKSGQNNGQNAGGQSSDSTRDKYNCFKCGGEHHTNRCTVTTPTADQKTAGKAAKESFYKARRKMGKEVPTPLRLYAGGYIRGTWKRWGIPLQKVSLC